VRRWARRAACSLAAAAGFAGAAGAEEAADTIDGWQLRPSVAWRWGDHRVDVTADTRWRWENWKARTASDSNLAGGRTRLGLRWTFRECVAALVEGQHAYVGGLTADSTGAAATYRSYTAGGDSTTESAFHLRQLWAEARPLEGLRLQVGRQSLASGSQPTYSEPAWKYLKHSRVSQRLVGVSPWSTAERSFDGVSGSFDAARWRVDAYTAQPTTGVYDLRNGYRPNWDVILGGAELLAKRGTLLANAELGGFFIGYSDGRDPDDVTGLFGDVRVYTLGGSALGVFPLGPGALDALVWGTGQFGEYADTTPSGVRDLDQAAWALIGEVGYQATGWPGKPWLRTGVNAASGDGDPDDGSHRTFFSVIPSTHAYYGHADQVAFQNLVNWFAQLRLAVLPGLDLELFVHRFWLWDAADGRYSGTGAFARNDFGFTRSASNGSDDIGTELDTVVSWQATEHVSFLAGFAYLWGGDVFAAGPNRDTQWAFAQVSLRY
jgi:hypothetical protein